MADLARLDELRRLFAEHPRRYFAPLASALRRAGDPAAAVAVVRAQLAEQPEHLTGHVILAQALADAGDLAGAAAAFERAHAVDAGNVVALGALVELARGRGDAAAEAHWTARLGEADPEPASARRAPPAAPPVTPTADGVEVEPVTAGFEQLDFVEVAAPESDAVAAAEHEADPALEPPPAAAAETPTREATPAPVYDPVVGLDDAPADPLPEPMREALSTLADPEPAEVAAPADRPDAGGGAPPPAAPFVTETMAGLLAAQGHTAQALEVYGQLLAQRPGDARLQARIDALRGGDAAGGRDAWAAEMWRVALAPLPDQVPNAVPVAAPDAAAPAADAELDDLSFDRFFEAFGDEPDPAPAEPAGDFERWADGVAVATPSAAAPLAAAAAPAAAEAAVAAPAAPAAAPPAYTPDDPDADLAAFNAWLRGVGA